jgi:hypothetical protein
MRRHHCWVPGWECALASAEDVRFSSLLGEVATYDGLRTVTFWSLGPGMMKMKCRARLVLPWQPGEFEACYAGCWYIYHGRGSPRPVTMVCRHRSVRSAVMVFKPPYQTCVLGRDGWAEKKDMYFSGVFSSAQDVLVMAYGPLTWFGQKVLHVYQPNEKLQWVSLYTLRTQSAEVSRYIIKPQLVISAWGTLGSCVLTATGPQVLDPDSAVVGHTFAQNSIWSCQSRLLNSNPQFVSRVPYPMQAFETQAVVGKHAITAHFPPQQRQFLRNMSGARLSWISVCA